VALANTQAFGEMAADSMIKVIAVNATRPSLGEVGVKWEDGAEKARMGGDASDEEHSRSRSCSGDR
jgi:hypothetical protein